MKILVLVYLIAAAFSSAAELGFRMMENGDRVELTVHSTGCFHDATSYYEVRKVERLKDGSGGFGLGEREDIVTFYSLARRFEKQNLETTDKNQEAASSASDSKTLPE